jgi:hypothetical protein
MSGVVCCVQQTGVHVKWIVEALLIFQGLPREGKDIYVLLVLACLDVLLALLVTPCLPC